MKLSDEQIQELLRVGNPSAEECRLIRMGWDAALARMRTTAVNDGWKLVPIVSTHEMDYAGSSHCDGFLSTAQAVWDTMLAVAPEPEAKP